MIFAPQNFFDRAQDGDLLNRRWISVNQTTGELSYDDYGVALPSCAVDVEEPAADILPDVDIEL